MFWTFSLISEDEDFDPDVKVFKASDKWDGEDADDNDVKVLYTVVTPGFLWLGARRIWRMGYFQWKYHKIGYIKKI